VSSISSVFARVLAHRHLPPRGSARLAALFPIVIVAGLIGLKARAGAKAPAALAPSDTVVVYGPLQFGSSGNGFEEIVLHVVLGKRYTLRVKNGAPDGSARATGGQVAFNNWEVVSWDDFTSARTEWNRVVEARGVDTLFLNAAGPAGTYFTVELLETADASFPIYGVERFTRGVGPVTQARTFTVPASAAAPYRLCLSNGNENGTRRVSDVTIRLNGTTVVSQARGFGAGVASLVRDVSLVPGANQLEVTLPTHQPAGFLDLCVTATDVTPPALSIGAPVPGLVTHDTVITVSGTVQDQTATSVTVNGVTAQRTGNTYTAQVLLTSDGNTVVTVTAVDGALLRTDSTRTVVRDRHGPVLTVTAPGDGLVTGQHAAALSGSVSDRTAVTVSANGVPVPLDSAGGFVGSVPLAEGANLVTVAASDAAGNQVVVVRSVRRTAGMPDVAMSGPGGGFSCLDQGGPLVTLSGAQTQQYFHVTLADSTKIDARTAYWNNVNYPSRIGGGVNLCWSGGEAHDSFPPSTAWATARSRYGHFVESASATDLEDMRIFNYGYGVSQATSGPNWSIRRALVKYSRATCVTNDFYHSGTIEDSFLDGCWRGVGADEQSPLGDSSANLVVIRNSLIRLQAIDSSFFSNVPNQSAFWEWNVHAPRMSLINNVFRADAHSREGQANRMYMAPPPGKLAECSGNIMVWLGKGPFPETLPACFTLTTNVAVWDSAVAAWNAVYPPVLADVATPIVSMFQPGVVGNTILTGTVTLIATAVDDRSVVGVQFEIDGQNIGQEQTSPTPYIGADSLLNRDFTTKYRIAWNSGTVANGTHALRARARDAAGHSKTSAAVSVTVSNGGLPPDPATVATPINPTVATNLGSSTAFLYTGANPIQTGVAPGTISPVSAAIVRGKLLTREGQPLSGVRIAVLGHSEYGQTLTRADGAYDLAVNGGGQLTIDYSKQGLLSVQRKVEAPWQDYAILDDVVLVALDPQVTTIAFAQPIEVARGTSVTDADGTRRATLLFAQGTLATMVLPDSSLDTLSTIHARATEYTTGPSGPAAMPAPLPSTSGYTYAVELSADEAIAAGASEVRFSKPVIVYLENFLAFPVGGAVPIGIYDRVRGIWVPRPNGRIVKILSTTGGIATLVVDTSGQPAGQAALDSLGISTAERQQLAALYQPGQSLWRMPTDHFSPMDGNWPSGPPPDAIYPNQRDPRRDDPQEDPCEQRRSIIECENQVLGEVVGLTGSPWNLNYRSVRAPGRGAARFMRVNVTGPAIPPSLDSIDVLIDVAGKRFTRSFSPDTNLAFDFMWDGKDAYGRTLEGAQPVTVTIKYWYLYLYSIPAQTASSFGLTCYGPGRLDGTIEPTWLACIIDPTPRNRIVFSLDQVQHTSLGELAATDLGGWTLAAHHAYDPQARVVQMGDGSRRAAQSVNSIIKTVAGNGTSGSGGDGGPATSASVSPDNLAVAADGGLLIADQTNNRIRRVGLDGRISTIAGNGSQAYSSDGVPATQTGMDPADVKVGIDGSIYLADNANFRVRRIAPNGIISTVAGNGTGNCDGLGAGDGGLATAAPLCFPYSIAVGPDGSVYIADTWRVRRVDPSGIITTVAGIDRFCDIFDPADGPDCGDGRMAVAAPLNFVESVEVGADGSLYIADDFDNVIRRVTPNGVITRAAGNFQSGFAGDGGLATEATLQTLDGIAAAPDGGFYFTDRDRIRRVTGDGIIYTVAGNGFNGFVGDGGAALQARLNSSKRVAVGPDGSVYLEDRGNRRVRRIAPPLPGFVNTEFAIASVDGAELYHFDAFGRHLRTVDPVSGAILERLEYDAAGRLLRIVDIDNDTLKIERDGSGVPTALVAPYGQRTSVSLSPDGYLATITNPAGEGVRPAYASGGLLSSLTDPRGHVSTFGYDSLGRLVSDSDAVGAAVHLANVRTDSLTDVTFRSALGRTTTYRIERTPTGSTRRVTSPAGLTTTVVSDSGGRATKSLPTGDSIWMANRADPRWGMQAPMPDSITVKLPSGLSATAKTRSHVTLAVADDPLSLVSAIDSSALNGKWTVSTYTAATRRLVQTRPEGRQAFATIDFKGRVLAAQIAGLDSVQFIYDDKGRLTQQQLGGRIATFSYDSRGRLLSTQDPLGRRDSLFYDNADRLIRRVLPAGRVVQFAYDSNGNLTSVTPPSRPAHGFQYTAVDLARQYDPPGIPGPKPTRYFYNLERQLDSLVRPDSIAIKFGYDTAGRPSSITFDRGTVTFGYAPTSGNLVAMRAPTGDSLKFTYDGSLPTQVRWTGSVTGTVAATYNTDLRVSTQTVNGANAVNFGYDRDGLLTSAGGLRLGRSTTNGLLVADTLGSVRSSYQYNSHGELKGYRVTRGGATPFGVGYARDSLARIVQLFDTTQGVPTRWSFAYDSVGRLKADSVNGAIFHAFTYDPNGNRLTFTSANGTVNYTYDNQDRLLSAGTTSYTYGSNGELKTKAVPGVGTTTYTYDALGNLVTVVLPSGTRIDYVIDGQNRRVGRKVNGVLVQGWLYQNQLNPVAELDGSGNVVSRFVYGGRANVPDYMTRNGVTYRLISDHLGSVRLVVDTATGIVAQRLDYDEWGNVSQNTNPGFQPFGFAGGLYETQTGLVRFGARDYDPNIGRWLLKDPTRFGGGDFGLYTYATGDPVNRLDPSGLFPIPACAKDILSLYYPNYTVDAANLEIGLPWFVRPGYVGITLGTIYIDPKYYDPESIEGIALIGHELEHFFEQQWAGASRPTGVVEWFGAYGLEYLYNLLSGMDADAAYRSIWTEQLADAMQEMIKSDLKANFPNGRPCDRRCQ
jgi:RHS repeat-associated protein